MAGVEDIDHGWNKVRAELKKAENAFVKVGVLQDAGTEEGGESLAQVATWNEFGTSRGTPSRPFMRQSFDKNLAALDAFMKLRSSAILRGKETAKVALEKAGIWMTGKVQREIPSGGWIPNAPYTIAMKKSSKPLIDSGRLRQSINHKVEGA